MGGEEKKCYNCTWFRKDDWYCRLHKRKMHSDTDTCRDHTKVTKRS